MNSAEPTWVAAEQPPVPEPSPPNGERVNNLTTAIKEEDGKTLTSRINDCKHPLNVVYVV